MCVADSIYKFIVLINMNEKLFMMENTSSMKIKTFFLLSVLLLGLVHDDARSSSR